LNAPVTPALMLRGTASDSEGRARANRVQILGIDQRFWSLAPTGKPPAKMRFDGVVLNERLARQLDVRAGDTVLLRMERPDIIPGDAPLSISHTASVAFRLTVQAVASEAELGPFNLQANQIPPFNAFVPLKWLQDKVELIDRVNLLLVGETSGGKLTTVQADQALRNHWELADADFELRELSGQGVLELRSGRIFIDHPAAEAAMTGASGAVGVLTYFVNELRVGDRVTPYSMVTAIGPGSAVLPPNMSDDEILINEWLANDLQAKPQDAIELTYFVPGPMRRLEQRTSRFRVRAVLPLKGPAADRDLMPMFPGLANVENCRDWEPGIPIDLTKIRKKDEQYWQTYRGTPKAFITLAAGQRIWGNRFGNLTAVRYPLGEIDKKKIESAIRSRLDPSAFGLFFQPVRERALAAAEQSLDFGMLFLGLSFFLIVAALLLTALLFVFGIEQRTEEVGTLLALGYGPGNVRRLLLGEGTALALIGGCMGTVAGTLYTRIVLYGLSTIWQGAVGSSRLRYHAEGLTLGVGAALGVVVAVLAMWVVLRRQGKRPARELLASGAEYEMRTHAGPAGKSKTSLWVGLVAVAAAIMLVAFTQTGRGRSAAGAFFASGSLLLIGGLILTRAFLAWLGQPGGKSELTLQRLGLRSTGRRIGRSLATVALLACGVFLVVAVGANRRSPRAEAKQRSSGTGGFALFGESTLPILKDLNSNQGRQTYGLEEKALENVAVVQLRVRDGDDASCLNLNRAQVPRLVGVRPEELQDRGAFSFVKMMEGIPMEQGWSVLGHGIDDNTVNAVGDEATVVWALGKSLGETLTYTDERGNTFNIRLVGMIGNSILQGSLLISEDDFVARFPSEAGYRMFLIDTPPDKAADVSKTLSRALQDIGIELTPTWQRLALFNRVENTYLSIFQMLGGLGLILGSVGLGMVVLRNVLERRGELALLRALGFRLRSLQWLVLCEHCLLLLFGLVIAVVSALVAVLPALRDAAAEAPYGGIALTILAVAASGILWAWLSTVLALRGPLLAALRNE